MSNKPWKLYIDLAKLKVIIPVGLSGLTGFLLYSPSQPGNAFLLCLGVILQAASASAINQIREKRFDSRMPRTMNRPVASGKISTGKAWIFSMLIFAAGTLLLFLLFGPLTALLGLFSLLWYILVYTELKKITAFAVIPGSLTGAIPPVMGWTAAGGHPGDLTAILLAFLFFMGQVPHFWLLVLKYGDQYEKAGFPALGRHFTDIQIKRLSFTWILTSFSAALLLAFFGIMETTLIKLALLSVVLAGIYVFRGLVIPLRNTGKDRHFLFLNLYFMALMILLIADKMIEVYA